MAVKVKRRRIGLRYGIQFNPVSKEYRVVYKAGGNPGAAWSVAQMYESLDMYLTPPPKRITNSFKTYAEAVQAAQNWQDLYEIADAWADVETEELLDEKGA